MSIVIVAHSVRDEVQLCLESIAAHAAMPVQTILVDNASEDGTSDWAGHAFPDVELVPLERNIGVAAREYGLHRVRAPYTMFLDSDARLTAGALPAMIEALAAHPDWGLIGPKLVHEDGTLQLSCRRFPPLLVPLLRRPPLEWLFGNGRLVQRHLMTDFDHGSARLVPYVLGACQLFRASLARAAGPFDAKIFYGPDDIDWCIRIRDAGGEIVYFPGATVVHDYRRMTAKRPVSRAALRHLSGFAYFRWKYRGRWRSLQQLERELDRQVTPR